ncbi:MAG: hypothetical protein ABL967_14325 [Bryobacteraceae bacterium]
MAVAARPNMSVMEKLHSSAAWHQIKAEFQTTGDASLVHRELSRVVDNMAMLSFSSTLGAAFPKGVAMLAVGGFGRKELFPYSDIDIMILVENEVLTGSIKESLSEFVRQLWDADLRLSNSVRTVEECLMVHEQNIELNISLLDRRFLAGDESVFRTLDNRFAFFLTKHGPKLGRALCEMTRARYEKYQDTMFHLEPDVKETPGGLRDLHFIHWLGILHPEQRNEAALQGPTAFISSLRCFLHYRGGRDRNVLDFESQDRAAEQSYSTEKTPELWIRQYFHNARAIFREARRTLDAAEKCGSSLLTNFRDWRTRLSNSEFSVVRERVLLRNPAQLKGEPETILRLLDFIGRHGIPAAAETERRLENVSSEFRDMCAKMPNLWKTLKGILAKPHAVMALRTLQNTGLLEAMLPEWKTIVSLVVRDFYHRYTVDEHTLVTIELLNELRDTKDSARGRFAGLLAEIGDPAILLFSLLYHDVGKGALSGDHSHISLEWAQDALKRMGAPADEAQMCEFLIEHHLALSDVMTGRDLGDPATARALADRIGTIERLKFLTVLTYADISAVNPSAMTPWRLEQLWRVYRVAQQELTRELETGRIEDIPEHLATHGDFVRGFPVRYLRTHSNSEIAAHLKLYEASRPTGVAAQIDRSDGFFRLTVIARDMPALFASFAGALSSFGVDILKAEAFSNAKGLVLDTFVFADPKRNLELNPSEIDRLTDLIKKVAVGKADVQRLLSSRPQTAKRRGGEPAVQFDSDACETATLVEIATDDRPGLLFNLATVFSSTACNIDVVLIDTQGHKAIDVFYVAQNGAKLTPEAQEMLRERLLAAC